MWFELLANELLLDLFEYLNVVDLLQAFIGLNYRFDNLLCCHIRRRNVDLHSIPRETFDAISESFLSLIIGQISSFRLSADETPGIANLFLSRGFTFDRFKCLQSLSLCNINSLGTLNEIVYQCRPLIHLRCLHITKYDVRGRPESVHTLLNNIWNLPKLVYCNLNGLRTTEVCIMKISTVSSKMKYLSIENITCNLNSIAHLFKYTPCLQQITTVIYSYMADDRLLNTLTLIQSMKLTFGGSLDALGHLFENMPNLSRLTISTIQICIDGHEWEQLITTYLPNIKVFQLHMQLECQENLDDVEDIVDQLLKTYQTAFWIVKHQWYVRIHWNPSDPFKWITLYTLPYSFDTFECSNKACSKSTCLDKKYYWFYDSVENFYQGSIENALEDKYSLVRARFRNIRNLQLNLPFDNMFWLRFPTLNRLTSLHAVIFKETGYCQLQTIFDQSPSLYSLKFQSFVGSSTKLFDLTSKSIRRIDLVAGIYDQSKYYNREDCDLLTQSELGIQCEVLSIRIKHRSCILELIRNLIKLRLLMFECEDSGDLFRNFSLNKNELMQWLQHHLPSTYTINKCSKHSTLTQIWINRDIKRHDLLNNDWWLKSKRTSKVSHALTTWRQRFGRLFAE